MRPSYESKTSEKILIESNDGDTFTSLAKPSSSITRHSDMIPSSKRYVYFLCLFAYSMLPRFSC
ncbi:unnamed protein product [Haemonchus placei]|uniref:Ovule protein n=1 Tax=Haemonchus placei TaxID=6290 RepID=A0A158QPI9_HAEPC|nr:unnamed protein product [Haemonchus placei]